MTFVAMVQLAAWGGCSAGMLETQTTHLFSYLMSHTSIFLNIAIGKC
jgi:hypothetical protein